jgi:hypothetical protein
MVEEPHHDMFGRTFVVADPDGNLLRGAPVDYRSRHAPTERNWVTGMLVFHTQFLAK